MVFASWLYVSVNLRFGAALATSATSVFWAAFTLSRLAAVFAARRVPPERALAVSFAGGLLFATLLSLLPQARSIVWIGAIGVGAAVGPIYPNIITAYAHRYELGGRRFGVIAAASCTGSMVFPWLAGRLLDVGGPVVVPAGTALLLAGAAAAAFKFLRRAPGPHLRRQGSLVDAERTAEHCIPNRKGRRSTLHQESMVAVCGGPFRLAMFLSVVDNLRFRGLP